MSDLLINSDEAVAKWTYDTFKVFPLPVNKAIGIMDKKGNICGGCLFQNYNSINVELSYYGPKTLTLGIIRYIAKIAATEFNVARLTVVTSQRNKYLIRALLKIGFKLEGVQRCFYGRLDTKKNAGVRLVVFRERIDQVAKIKKDTK